MTGFVLQGHIYQIYLSQNVNERCKPSENELRGRVIFTCDMYSEFWWTIWGKSDVSLYVNEAHVICASVCLF